MEKIKTSVFNFKLKNKHWHLNAQFLWFKSSTKVWIYFQRLNVSKVSKYFRIVQIKYICVRYKKAFRWMFKYFQFVSKFSVGMCVFWMKNSPETFWNSMFIICGKHLNKCARDCNFVLCACIIALCLRWNKIIFM